MPLENIFKFQNLANLKQQQRHSNYWNYFPGARSLQHLFKEMSDPKLAERFATPNSSKLAQILLDLRGVEDSTSGICNLQPSDVQLWPEAFSSSLNQTSLIAEETGSSQDTCNCRKSRCLKLYCQCFAARATCSASCRCVSCENRPDNAAVRDVAVNLILERNPNAFDSKYRPTAPAMSSNFTAITSIAHKNGCRCRKSMCLKKYCECFQGGVPCSAICTCLACQNTAPAVLPGSTVVRQQQALDGQQLPANHSSFTGPNKDLKSEAGVMDVVELSTAKGIQATSDSSEPCRPPLIPSHKRKREVVSDRLEGVDDAEVQGEQQVGGAAAAQVPAASSAASAPLTPGFTRAQQQQLLEQLLYQELEREGLLSSPFASFVNLNCPGLLQGQSGAAVGDMFSLFSSHLRPPANVTVTAGSADAGGPLATPASGEVMPSTAMAPTVSTPGVQNASPNSISIATALALLAANAQAQARAAVQQTAIGQTVVGPSTDINSIPNNSVGNFLLVTPRDKVASCRDSGGIADSFSGSTPEAVHGRSHISRTSASDRSTVPHDCTDEETMGTGSSSRSDALFSRSNSINGGQDSAYRPHRKDLFGAAAECLETPDGFAGSGADCGSSGASSAGFGTDKKQQEFRRFAVLHDEGAAKENSSPNTQVSGGVGTSSLLGRGTSALNLLR